MSETMWALVAGAILAFIGLGVAVLAVPNHPDQVKAAKAFFSLAAIVFVGTLIYWTSSTARGLLTRIVIDLLMFGFIALGLVVGFRFANRSSLADLGIPSSAILPEPVLLKNKQMLLIVSGIIVITGLLNGAAGWVSQSAILWGIPWRWVLPSMIAASILQTILVRSRRQPNEVERLRDTNASLLKEKQQVETKLAEVQLEYAKTKPDTQIIKPLSIVPCGEPLLHSLADKDRYWIDQAVFVVTIDPQPEGLTSRAPYIEFRFIVYNASVFPIAIDDSLVGYISFRERSRPEKKLDLHKTLDPHEARNIPPRGQAEFTVTQEITPNQANLFRDHADDVTFSFEHLTLKIKGANDSDKLIVQELSLRGKTCGPVNRYLYYEPEAARAYSKLSFVEVAKLKAELEEERRKTKPEISGEIREVLFEKAINLETSLVISEDCYFSYWFYVRLYVVNLAAATTVERYRLILRTKEDVLEGQRLSLAGYSLDDAINGKLAVNKLIDIEDQNDIPLEHTRNGWICFGVPSIKSNKDDGAVEDMQIEVQVIDKAKTQHPLGRSAQAEWRENSQHQWPRIQPARGNLHGL